MDILENVASLLSLMMMMMMCVKCLGLECEQDCGDMFSLDLN